MRGLLNRSTSQISRKLGLSLRNSPLNEGSYASPERLPGGVAKANRNNNGALNPSPKAQIVLGNVQGTG